MMKTTTKIGVFFFGSWRWLFAHMNERRRVKHIKRWKQQRTKMSASNKWDYFIPYVIVMFRMSNVSIVFNQRINKCALFGKNFQKKKQKRKETKEKEIKCDVFMTPCMFVAILFFLLIWLWLCLVTFWMWLKCCEKKRKKKIAVACVEQH